MSSPNPALGAAKFHRPAAPRQAVPRPALVLYHEEARRKQWMTLCEARYKLPAGKILLTSIEAMEAGGWAWEELTTPR